MTVQNLNPKGEGQQRDDGDPRSKLGTTEQDSSNKTTIAPPSRTLAPIIKKQAMPYYILAHYSIIDTERFRPYAAAVLPTILQYGGKVLAAAGPDMQTQTSMEGTPQHSVTVILQFGSREQAERWQGSAENSRIKHFRTQSSEGWVVGLPGFPSPRGASQAPRVGGD